MGLSIKKGENKSFEVKNKTVTKIDFRLKQYHGTANTAFTGPVVELDPSKVIVKLVLNRKGRDFQLLNSDLRLMHLHTNFENASFDLARPGATSGQIVLLAAASGVKEIILTTLSIVLPGPINLSGSDTLVLDVNFMDGAAGTNLDATSSLIDIDFVEQPGAYEYFTPMITTSVVQANQSQIKESFGDNILRLTLLNLDKTGLLDADAVISNARVQTDRYEYSENYIGMLGRRLTQFPTVAIAATRLQSFMLHTGSEVDALNVDLNLNSSNVNASKNYFVKSEFYTDARLVGLAAAKRKKHDLQAQVKVGVITPTQQAKDMAIASSMIKSNSLK